ncbi:MAG TPA: ECF-type sigma factor [Bryobacteraceae bacterium]|nr:ECF-type sigma factor [Bryobacteraceae bacterium]
MQLFADFRSGDKTATNRLVAVLYPELRRIAAAQMRSERAEHSWQPTVLVNELYLELLKVKSFQSGRAHADGQDKEAFFSLAAHMMKRLLIHHARPLAARATKVPVDESLDAGDADFCRLQEIEDLLGHLAKIDPRLRSVVEMKVFEDLSIAEIAAQLNCSPRSVARYWSFARQWLKERLGTQP